MAINTELLSKYARMYLARAKLQAKYNELTDRLQELEPRLIDHMTIDQEEPVDMVSLKKNGIIVEIQTQVWATLLTKEKEKIAQALRSIGQGHVVSTGINSSSLSAYVREVFSNDEKLPKELDGLIGSIEKKKLKARRSK